MKVLLKEDVEHVGYAGEVHKVADGYGRNFLIPRGLAVLATSGALKQAEMYRERAEARRAQLRAEYDALSEKINAITLEFEALAGDGGRLYGSITTQQIADALNEKLGTDIERRKILGTALREVGEHQVGVRLDRDHTPEVTVVIRPEGGEEEVIQTELQPVTEAEVEDAEDEDSYDYGYDDYDFEDE